MMTELKPCPFCGSEAEVKERNSKWMVYCNSFLVCGVVPSTHFYGTKEEAIEAWNRRVSDD